MQPSVTGRLLGPKLVFLHILVKLRSLKRRESCAIIGFGAQLEETQNKGLAINLAQMKSNENQMKANQELHEHFQTKKGTLAEISKVQTLEILETGPLDDQNRKEGEAANR